MVSANNKVLKKAEFVQFTSTDGLNLPGLLFKTRGNEIAIFLHGSGSSSIFYYNDYSLPSELLKRGISTLMFNNRGAHLIHKLDKISNSKNERKKYGMAFELIDEAMFDIDGAIDFLGGRGYKKFYLIGGSTGANKIVAYNRQKPNNIVERYVLIAGGDDLGYYYNLLGKKKLFSLLEKASKKIKEGKGEDIVKDLLPDFFFSYKSLYDIINPEGSYNVFPYMDYFKNLKITHKEKFSELRGIKKPTLVVYGDEDEFAIRKIEEIINLLKTINPILDYRIIKNSDHGFKGTINDLSKVVANWLAK